MRRLGQWVVMTGLIFSLGLHWAVIQSFAWATMVVRYAQDEPLRVALSKTFDGSHPCSLCHFVAAGRQADPDTGDPRHSSPRVPFDLFIETPARFILAVDLPDQPVSDPVLAAERSEPPPLPPPRFV